jgi:AraC family transcriptional regulator of adaptative response/methylated-DNA-[protein]-cysteine methyltransferase
MNTMATERVRTGGPADRDTRWRAVVAREASADGTFVYSVRSTGV